MGIDLSKFYQDNNFKYDGKLFYGIYKNRVLSISERGNYLKACIAFNEMLEKEIGQIISNKISEVKFENRALQRGITTNVGIELYFYQSADLQFEFIKIIDKIYEILETNHLKTCEICPLCGQIMPSDSPFFKMRENVVIQGHNHCIDFLLSSATNLEKQMNKDSKKTMIKSLLSNLITMLAICILIVGLSMAGIYSFVSIISGWLYLFVIKFVMFKCKIPAKLKYYIINIIFAVLTAVITTFFGTIFDLSVNNDLKLSYVFAEFFDIIALENFYVLKYMAVDFALCLIFIALNSFFDIKRLLSSTKVIKKL